LYGASYCTVGGNWFKADDDTEAASIQIDGIGDTDPWYNTITGNVIEYGGNTSGIELRHKAHYNAIVGNFVAGCTGDGIMLGTSIGTGDHLTHYNTVAGNVCTNNAVHGIKLLGGAQYNAVSGNTCIKNGQDGTGSGIHLEGALTLHNSITGNVCYDQDYGIRELDSTDYNSYSNNRCAGNGTASHAFVGTHNTYDGRVVSDAVQINGATTKGVATFTEEVFIARATLLYETAVANDTNIEVGYGRDGAADRNYYVTSVSSGTGNIWKRVALTLAKNDFTAGDTITFYQDGSGGAGEYVRLIIDYVLGA